MYALKKSPKCMQSTNNALAFLNQGVSHLK